MTVTLDAPLPPWDRARTRPDFAYCACGHRLYAHAVRPNGTRGVCTVVADNRQRCQCIRPK